MPHLEEVLKLLVWPFVACISMGLLHGYAGLHVLRRGVIFVDLALAQIDRRAEHAGNVYAPGRPGLEHFSYELESLAEIEQAARFLQSD